jgi:hypothetical protein
MPKDTGAPAEKTRRVLFLSEVHLDGAVYPCRTVADLPAALADSLVADSLADDTRDAWEQAIKDDKAKPVTIKPTGA